MNLNLGKTSTNPKCHLTISWTTSCQYTNVYAKFHYTIPLSSRDKAIFHFFKIWSSAKPRPMKNDFSQSLGLDLDNINVSAKTRPIINVILQKSHFFSEFCCCCCLFGFYVAFNNFLVISRRQGDKCSLLYCCLTEVSCPRHWTTPSHIILTLGQPVLALPRETECQARSS